jgi:hypothetical protein
MKAYWGSRGISPLIDLGTTWRGVVSFTPRLLYPQGRSPSYPLDRRLAIQIETKEIWKNQGRDDVTQRRMRWKDDHE